LITFERNSVLGHGAQYVERDEARRPQQQSETKTGWRKIAISATRRFAELVKAK
jgi:hypothetical protein